jgi:UDP-N-acetylmuramate: L-alanyl-gamma-D-glutamyl-meso-diaminopimelate ligase
VFRIAYSSLNAEFLKNTGALEYVDKAVVFYSPDAVKSNSLKKLLTTK